MSTLTTEEQKLQLTELCLKDPIALSKSLFNSRHWSKQEEVIRSVWNNPRTAVKSCNSGGKSRIAAEITLLYLITFRPSRVITTAPTFLQVESILWKEIGALYQSSKWPIGGQLNKTSLDLGVTSGRPWGAMGISTNEVNRFQGFKSPHLLVILDEALGVAPEIWEAMEGLQPHRILAIGNPLEANGDFFNCFSSSLWNKITIDGEECVKWQEEHGRIPGLITREWLEERREEWGDKSPLYLARCRGEFPLESSDSLISRKWLEDARHTVNDGADGTEVDTEEDSPRTVACDVATKHGENETVIGYRYGHTVKTLEGFKRITIIQSADKLSFKYNKHKPSVTVVDSDGVGEGLSDVLSSRNIPITEFHGGYGYKAMDGTKFKNLRSQFYWITAKKFEKGMYSLDQLGEKEYELLKNQLCCIKVKAPDAMGRIQIETKDDLAVRGIKSPDYADCFVYLEYAWYMSKFADLQPVLYR